MSKVAKGSGAAEAAQSSSQLLLEAQKHLPSPEAVGTFMLRKRISTPSGRPIAPPRPSSAVASRSRGLSVGAEESRPASEVRMERAGNVTPTLSMIKDVETWVRDAQHQLKKSSVVSPTLKGDAHEVIAVATQRALRQQWRSRLLQEGRHRSCYPVAAVGVADVAQRGPMDRLATLLHAVGQYKQLVDSGRTPDLTLPATNGGKPITLHANGAHSLFGSTVKCSGSASSSAHDIVCGADHSARHAALVVGTHVYQLDLFHPDGRLLAAVEIRSRVQAAVTHAASSTHPHEFLGTLSTASNTDKKSWLDIAQVLSATCLANRQSMQLLDTALFVITLAPHGAAEDVASVLNGDMFAPTAVWSGAALQLTMYDSGLCVFRASTLFVDTVTLALFAQWTSHAANTDPMLNPHEPASPVAAQGLRRLPLCLVRPATGGAKPTKGAPAASSAAAASNFAADNLDANLEETASIVEVAIPRAPRAALLRPLPLWLPVAYAAKISALNTTPMVHSIPFSLSTSSTALLSSGAIELACVLAVDRALRVGGDELPPLVRYSRASPTSCPDETAIFSESILNALHAMKAITGPVKSLGNLQKAQLRRTMTAGLESVACVAASTLPAATTATEAASIAPPQYLPIARNLSRSGHFPDAPTLRRGEACAAADVLIFMPFSGATQLGCTFVLERGSLGLDSARFSLSVLPNDDLAAPVKAILHCRRDDEQAAVRFIDQFHNIFEQLATLCY